MDDESFEQLCRETCAALNLSDLDALSSTNQITVDGVNIGVFFNAADIEDRVICYIDIGHVRFHCWAKHGHGSLDLHGGLKFSCDVFFFETARRDGRRGDPVTRPLERGALPLTQYDGTPGVIDLAWGHPDPSLLPVDELRAAADGR